jgi:hypothetical protein
MVDQVGSGAVAGIPTEGGPVGATEGGPAGTVATGGHAAEPFHGRAVSWVAVSIIMAGFLVGGLGLTLGPLWWMFWVGVGLVAVGGLLALATNIFEDWY